jgi:hypothetical protein
VTVRFDEATRPELLIALRALLSECDELQRRIRELDTDNQRLAREICALERENATLTHLQVASRLLHRTLDRKQVYTAIHEVIVNLIGCEQLALFAYERRRHRLGLVSWLGVDEQQYAFVPVDSGLIGDCVRTGEIQLYAPETADATTGQPTACVPLKVDGKVVGALVLFKLLDHKPGIEDVDLALFEMLSHQAGVAMVSTYPTGPAAWM